jgi:fructose-1-phosphate kinase PfkB-like protein
MDEKRKSVLVAGLNPAWQRILEFDDFKAGEVNRARSLSLCAAGKGVNFARAAKTWGLVDSKIVQFAGGDSGASLLAALDAEALPHLTRTVETPTRVCVTLLSSSGPRMTELIEPSGRIQEQDSSSLLAAALAELENSDALAICGTCPPGVEGNFYGALVRRAADLGRPILVDSVAFVAQTLPHLRRGLLKLNLDELKFLTDAKSAEEALRFGRERLGVASLAATDGPRTAYFVDESGVVLYEIPPLGGELLNPLGAGDTCSAVTLSEILSGTSPSEAFARGLAAASASCLTRLCAEFSKDVALEIRGRMAVKSAPRM